MTLAYALIQMVEKNCREVRRGKNYRQSTGNGIDPEWWCVFDKCVHFCKRNGASDETTTDKAMIITKARVAELIMSLRVFCSQVPVSMSFHTSFEEFLHLVRGVFTPRSRSFHTSFEEFSTPRCTGASFEVCSQHGQGSEKRVKSA